MKKDPMELVFACINLFGVTLTDLCSKRRYEPLATYRKVTMAVLHNNGFSDQAIAMIMKKDRTTVIQNLQTLGIKKGARNK